jgi:hypothetical protein
MALRCAIVAAAVGRAAGYGLSNAMPGAHTVRRASSASMSAFYDFTASTIDGKETSMSAYKGKPVLIVNVASL